MAAGLAALGFSLGMVLGGYREYVRITESQEFMHWKKEAVSKKVFPIFEKYIKDSIPEKFLCGYTLSLISVPVVALGHPGENPHVFERSSIMEELELRGGKVKCLTCQTEITENDLTYDEGYFNRVLKILKPIFESSTADAVVVAGAQAFHRQAVAQSANMVQAESRSDFEELVQCKNDKEREIVLTKMAEKAKSLSQKYKVG